MSRIKRFKQNEWADNPPPYIIHHIRTTAPPPVHTYGHVGGPVGPAEGRRKILSLVDRRFGLFCRCKLDVGSSWITAPLSVVLKKLQWRKIFPAGGTLGYPLRVEGSYTVWGLTAVTSWSEIEGKKIGRLMTRSKRHMDEYMGVDMMCKDHSYISHAPDRIHHGRGTKQISSQNGLGFDVASLYQWPR